MRWRWARWALALLVVIFVAATAAPVLAQRSGGSFGGGGFRGGGGSFGGGGRSFGGGGRSYGGGGYSGGGGFYGGGYSAGRGAGSPLCTFAVVGIIVVLVVFSAYRRAGGTIAARPERATHGARGWGSVDVSAIQLAIDWRARRELQAELERLARRGQTGTRAGLAHLLREAVLGVRRAELSWLYAAASNYHPMSAPMAEGIFRQLCVDARSRFRDELVRNVDGHASTEEAPEMRARPEEGEGVVVVTIVVAARREILDVHEHADANRIKSLLADLVGVATPETLVAMEVIWSPAAENDRMSTAELEAIYPHLEKIDERSIAGRIFCGYCRGPFAAELLTCPHCGAPAPAASAES